MAVRAPSASETFPYSYLSRLDPDIAREVGKYVQNLYDHKYYPKELKGRSIRELSMVSTSMVEDEEDYGPWRAENKIMIVSPCYDWYSEPCDQAWWGYVLNYYENPYCNFSRLLSSVPCLCGRFMAMDRVPGHSDCGPIVITCSKQLEDYRYSHTKKWFTDYKSTSGVPVDWVVFSGGMCRYWSAEKLKKENYKIYIDPFGILSLKVNRIYYNHVEHNGWESGYFQMPALQGVTEQDWKDALDQIRVASNGCIRGNPSAPWRNG